MRPHAQFPIFRSPNFNGLFNSCLTAQYACRYLRLQLINPDKHATYVHLMNTRRKSPKSVGAWPPVLITLGIILSLVWSSLLIWLLLRLFHLV